MEQRGKETKMTERRLMLRYGKEEQQSGNKYTKKRKGRAVQITEDDMEKKEGHRNGRSLK